MFAVNYTTAIAGADFAYVNHGFTAQGEATLLQFVRVRGEDGIGATDSFRTEAAVGLHLGYFIGSHFSLSSDLHYRRWLSHPTTLSAATGARVAVADGDMASTTVAVGPRFHFRVGKHAWMGAMVPWYTLAVVTTLLNGSTLGFIAWRDTSRP